MHTKTEISNSDDLIDVRDVIARVEELRGLDEMDDGDKSELLSLEAFLEEMRWNGGDEQWEGGWYPVTAIRDSYFQDYAEQLAGDIGAIDATASWPNSCIDWERAASELQMDYTSVDFDGTTYWVR